MFQDSAATSATYIQTSTHGRGVMKTSLPLHRKGSGRGVMRTSLPLHRKGSGQGVMRTMSSPAQERIRPRSNENKSSPAQERIRPRSSENKSSPAQERIRSRSNENKSSPAQERIRPRSKEDVSCAHLKVTTDSLQNGREHCNVTRAFAGQYICLTPRTDHQSSSSQYRCLTARTDHSHPVVSTGVSPHVPITVIQFEKGGAAMSWSACTIDPSLRQSPYKQHTPCRHPSHCASPTGVTVRCARPSKTTQNPKASNMAELTKIYFACYTKIHKSMSDGSDKGVRGGYLATESALGHILIISIKSDICRYHELTYECVKLTEDLCVFSQLSNNQINLTTAGSLIKKNAGDKAKESMAVLAICANKVGVQPNECLAGDLACNCVIDVSIRQHREKSSLQQACQTHVTPNLHSGSSSPSNGEQEEASTSKKQTFIYYTLPLISVPSAPNLSTPDQLHLPLPPIPKEPPTVQANPLDIWMHIHSPRTEDLYFHPRRQLPGFPQTLGNLSSGFRSYLETGLALEEK
uniref:Uncharacterized protein n=1 Tax=Timema genevievae TaxID=629358 RepID=A0A7R9PPN5_TIMGE|nr:unnamed protein product [Timema genevievae]